VGTVFTFTLALRERLVAAGRFLTMVPGFLMRSPGRYPLLRELPIALPATHSPVAIVTLKNRALSPVAELFIARVREVAQQLAEQ
jgi:DNA-binding transcriptional LysR family regulator